MATRAHISSSGTEDATFAESGKPAAKMRRSGSSNKVKEKDGEGGESTGLWGEDGCFCAKTKAERLHGHHNAKDRIYSPLRSQIHLD